VNPDHDYCPTECHYEAVGRIKKGERRPGSFCDECPLGNEYKIFEESASRDLKEIEGADRWSFNSLLIDYNTLRSRMKDYEENGYNPKWRRFICKSIDVIRKEIQHQERKREWEKRKADEAAAKPK
jgi:hypothetical protein